jgi:hypothetical protein
MKRYMVLVLMMVSAAALFANGTGEETDASFGARGRGPAGLENRAVATGDPIELEGTLEFVDGHPVLNTGDSAYLLGAPRAGWYANTVEEGGDLSVAGTLRSEPVGPASEMDVDGHVAVTSATYDGQELSIAKGPSELSNGRFGARADDRGPTDRRGQAPGRGRAPSRGRRG